MLIQSSQSNANIHVPQTIRWTDIKLPQEWRSTNESFKPEIISQNLDNLDYIKQYLDGTVKIEFGRKPKSNPESNLRIEELPTSSSFRQEAPRSSSSRLKVLRSGSSRLPKDKIPARHSFAGSTTMEELKRRDLELEKELRNLKL
jgi:hypothetical protein